MLPGFIQGHIHLPQALFKRMFDNSPDSNNLGEALDRIALYESKHTPETLYASARFGIAELLKSGTTGVIDMGTLKYQDSIFQAIEESGIRAQAGKAMMDLTENLPPYLRESTEQSLKKVLIYFTAGTAKQTVEFDMVLHPGGSYGIRMNYYGK